MGTGLGHRAAPAAPEIGRANALRPASSVVAALLGATLAGLVALSLLSTLSPSSLWRGLTVGMAWFSVVFALLRLGLLLLRPRQQADMPLPDASLPRYTVIIPLFREAHMVPGLVEALGALDYPADKLDIVFACEMVDPDTADAARAVTDPRFRTLVVPAVTPGGEPQTKPRALNAVLAASSSELVTIYDAEDRPHPQQLRAAANAFADHPDWDALQAPLDYFNTGDSWLAAQFGLEYAGLFHVLLPAYDRLGLPFPLGGTSNHMRRGALERAGGWDAFNVTEDADLAFRLSLGARRIGWIAPPTREEAVARLRPWMRQRSRWLKGYIQTWLVHMNAPVRGGWRRALMLQLSLGVSLLCVALYAPVMGLLAALAVFSPSQLQPVYLATLACALCSAMAVGALGAVRAEQPRLLRHVPLMPLYWLLMFPPLVRALWELRTNPYHWHKTEHGISGAQAAE